MTYKSTELGDKIKLRADRDGLASGHPLREAGENFTKAANGYLSHPQTMSVKKFMGAYARAKRLWSEYTGDPLT